MTLIDIITAWFLGGNRDIAPNQVSIMKNGRICHAMCILSCECKLIVKTDSHEYPYIPIEQCSDLELRAIIQNL